MRVLPRFLSVLAAALSPLVSVSPAFADVIVIPGAYQFIDAPGAQSIPFGFHGEPTVPGALGIRYQQVFDSGGTTFRAELVIVEGGFRRDPASLNITMPVPVALTRLTVNFSETPRGPDGLSTVFGDNVGSNVVTVFDAPLVGVIPGCFSNPCPFFTYRYTTPYSISPSLASGASNLLVDIRLFGPEIPFQFVDAADVLGDEVSRVFAPIIDVAGAFGIAAEPTTGRADTAGLVMQFTLSDGVIAPPPGTVPEPTSLALLGISLAIFGMTRRRNKT